MDAIAYGVTAASPKAAKNRDEAARPRQTWFARVMDALTESRRQQAAREIRRYAHLLSYSLDERGNRLVKIGKTEMPFGGW